MNPVTPFRQKSEPVRLTALPLEVRTAVYDLVAGLHFTKNHHIQAALNAAVETHVRDHYSRTFGEGDVLTVNDFQYVRGMLIVNVQCLRFPGDYTDHFRIDADLFSGENFITVRTQ